MFDRTRRARLLLIVLIVASLVVISIGFRSDGDSPLDAIGRGALAVLGPIQKGIVTITRPIGNFFSGFTQVGSLKSRIADLERQNGQLRAQQEQVEDVVRENVRLRELLALRDRNDLATMPAQVTGVGPTNFGRTIFIDKGSSEGVRKDMPVVSGEGLVGRVVQVGRSEAVVMLIIDRASAVAGRLASNGEQGIVEGRSGRLLDFRILDPEAAVKVGDRVVTSGYQNGLFPPGIPIGKVAAAPPAGSSTSRLVQVEPLVDFSSLDYVLLVTGAQRGPR